MSILPYLFHYLSLKLSNNGIDFSFHPLKLPNKKIEVYSKIILFISFISLLPNEGSMWMMNFFENLAVGIPGEPSELCGA